MTGLRRLAAPLILATAIGATAARAEPLDPARLPAPLKPWTDWVLHGEEAARCPFLDGGAAGARCAWPSRLALTLDDRSGAFVQEWFLHAPGAVPLPGDERSWPEEARVDGSPAAVVAQRGIPTVRLAAGRHTVAGRFAWPRLPESLQVPAETGLLALTIAGREVPFPTRDDQGRLWLARGAVPGEAADRLELRVHRRVVDDVPLVLVTRADLEVSGRSREVLLGRALPDRFVPMRLDSPLPARLEADGRLRLQVRPGTWTVELAARHDGPVAALGPGAPGAPWPAAEVWVFEARPALRVAAVEGVPAVDPTQTTLPDDWKGLPAFRVGSGDTMRLVEKRRGDSDPAPDRLSLARTLWLDFDGRSLTVHDEITGSMRRGWRLEMRPPASLGRVAVAGRDQPITRVPPSELAGVEVRQGQLHLSADSRVPRAGAIPAVGWDHPFQAVEGTLHLPPGWRLLAVSGADDAGETWVSSWSLLDLFLVLVTAMAVRRLYGWRWGLAALATLALIRPEAGAPGWLWLAVLAGEALRRLLGESRRLRLVVLGFRGAALVLLVLVAVPFVVGQVRGAIYPVLEGPGGVLGLEEAGQPGLPGLRFQKRAFEGAREARDLAEAPEAAKAPAGRRGDLASTSRFALDEVDPKALVQTGPGLPEWEWRAVRVGFRGPVEPDQTVRLWLAGRRLNALLALARVALVSLLLLRLLSLPAARLPTRLRPLLAALALASLVPAAVVASPRSARAETPSPEVLAELKRRLLEKPDCFPACVSVGRLDLAVTPRVLRARLEVGAQAATAVPLPGGLAQWSPERVLVDGRAARGLLRTPGGLLWVELAPGPHQVILEGALPDRDAVEIALPARPRRVTVRAEGWRVDGVGDDGTPGDALRLGRRRPGVGPEAGRLAPGALPPFVRVERTLRLGLTWQVETRVARVTPAGSAILLEVPLLDGESVTTAGVRVVGGRAVVAMGPQASEGGWRSILPARPALRLVAPAALEWTEVWRLDASPVWHVAPSGIPAVHREEAAGPRVPEWRPWPREAVALAVTRPEPLPGRTLTIDGSRLVVRPGARTTEAELTLRLRSSRGGEHAIVLPEGAELLAVSIGGAPRPLRAEGRTLTLPVVPGAQEVQVAWREPRGMGIRFRGPEVELGTPSVNAAIEVRLPADRWLLLAGGPRVGPAVLFWSVVVVLALIAAGLGRLDLTPLRFRHWLLLGLGLSQVSVAAAAVVVGWFLALGWRGRRGQEVASDGAFDAVQVLLAVWTVVALALLVWSIEQGLLGHPDMQVAGNGSTRDALRWFQDRTDGALPRPWVVSVPLLVYRGAMLAWALWLAGALLGWLRWGFRCVGAGGFWRRRPPVVAES